MDQLNFSWVISGRLAGHQAPSSMEDLLWLKKQGVLALVRMAQPEVTTITSSQIEHLGISECHEPVSDFTAPDQGQIKRIMAFIVKSLAAARPVGVSCGAGKGRTGTILACYFVSQGWDAQKAMTYVRSLRPGSIETKAQENAVIEYAKKR
jgi:atypical dual specificity phosphatase